MRLLPEPPDAPRAPEADGAARISIIIPTVGRPEGLSRAARSTFRQTGIDRERLELVIVDNDPAGSTAPLADALRVEAPFPMIYVHEPRRGVASARNAGLARASGALIAFIDDDEEAEDGWLAALAAAQARFDADAVFGPVRGRAPPGTLAHRAYLEAFFSREGPAEAGRVPHGYGCGNSLLRGSALPDPPFNVGRDETGGEDDHLFALLERGGARFAWTPEAVVYEDPLPERLTLRYALQRAFAYGQAPSFSCATGDPPRLASLARWMTIGLAQALVFCPLAAAEWALRAPDRAFAFDRAARGLGKVFFGGPFKRAFYGPPSPEADARSISRTCSGRKASLVIGSG